MVNAAKIRTGFDTMEIRRESHGQTIAAPPPTDAPDTPDRSAGAA